MSKKSNISYSHYLRNKTGKHKQRLGIFAAVLGFLLIMLFAVFLLPLFLYMLIFNKVYFWVRNQNSISPKPYYNFDRHRIAHLGLMDRVWCEYCEWANGSLQWISAVVHEIERRYCPIQNHCDPHCPQAKKWRKEWRNDFLKYDHTPEELEKFLMDGKYEEISECEKNSEPSAEKHFTKWP